MLTATIQGQGHGLGVPELTAEDQTKLPEYVSIAERIKEGENACLGAYTNIVTLVDMIGDQASIPVKMLANYNDGVNRIKLAAEDWVEAQRNVGQPSTPTYPPQFTDAGGAVLSGAHGLGQDVPVAQVRVVYGPQGREQSVPLSQARLVGLGDYGPALQGPWTPIIIVVGIAIGGATLAWVIHEWRSADVARARARANEARENNKGVKMTTDTFFKVYSSCAGNTTSTAEKIKCAQVASGATKSALDAYPKVKGPGIVDRLGFFGTIGVIVVLGGLGYGGYRLYQYRKARGGFGPEPEPEMAGYRRRRRRR